MLEIKNLSKSFDDENILSNFNLIFEKGKIYGLLGTNGAGKSTFLRTISGIYNANSGVVTLDGANIYENIVAKGKIFYIPDENSFLPEKTIQKNINFYKSFYNTYDEQIFEKLQEVFKLDINRDIKTFSKGMKKQALFMVSLCFTPEYIILDETFDGLDPLIRVKVKKLLIELVEEKNFCIIISTHNISDIENLVDELIIINNNEVIVNNLSTEIYLKLQLAFSKEVDINNLGLEIVNSKKLGSVITIICKNSEEEIKEVINPLNPLVFDIYHLTKEELFLTEVEGI